MAKVTKTSQEEQRQQNLAEAVSKSEQFFNKNGNLIFGILIGVLVIAFGVLGYKYFFQGPKEERAAEDMRQATEWFNTGEYELALNGDDNDLGFADILDKYGSSAGEAVYMYTGICRLHTGAYEDAIDNLKKYNGSEANLLSRAQACIGDAYVELEDYESAISYFEKAAKTVDSPLAASYLLKAGIAAEADGEPQKALEFYKTIKDKWEQSPEASEIDKYITRIETAE